MQNQWTKLKEILEIGVQIEISSNKRTIVQFGKNLMALLGPVMRPKQERNQEYS